LRSWGKGEEGAERECNAIAKAYKEECFKDTEEGQQDEGGSLLWEHEDRAHEIQDRVDKACRPGEEGVKVEFVGRLHPDSQPEEYK
jgi:hypothetical protein